MNRSRLIGLRDELEQELKGNILPYWMEHLPDPVHGGFHGHLTYRNRVVADAPRGAIQNARILWTFSAAFRFSPDEKYRAMAKRAYDYILSRFIDGEWGGVYWELDYLGEVKSSRKQMYALAFVIYAMAEYHMAFGEDSALETATGLFRDIEAHAFDAARNGYTEALDREWTGLEDLRLSEKDDNESKTMNTHLHILEAYANLFRIWKEPVLEKALANLIHLFLDIFVDRRRHHLNLFFDDQWNLKSTLVSFGHDIECSWLLHEAAVILGDPGPVNLTGVVAVDMARESFSGLDRDGGLYYEYFPAEKRFDTDKHWWPQAEAMVGYFNAYQLSGEDIFMERALQSWEFIREKLVDREFGEWYWSVNRDGIPQVDKEKAGFWKCPYHNGRACMEMIRRIDETINIKQDE
jgi:mannobiose 2-epimerase